MRIASSSRWILGEVESHIKTRNRKKAISHWKSRKSPFASNETFRTHVMLTKNIEYVDLAEVCFFSFLHHHPNTQFIFHCDETTMEYAIEKFSLGSGNTRVDFEKISNQSGLNWQEQKLEIILSLSGSSDLMLDADLRWNAALEKREEVLFLVKEFDFKDKSPFREIVKNTNIGGVNASMKNTSVFTFGGFKLSVADVDLIRQTLRQYREVVDSKIVGNQDKADIGRVIEQFVLSVCSEKWQKTIGFVKETDKPFDGGIVESCYFGATGGKF